MPPKATCPSVQPGETMPAMAHCTQQGSSSARALQLQLLRDFKHHKFSTFFQCCCFLATNKCNNNMNKNLKDVAQWVFCMRLSWCPCWSLTEPFASWYFGSMVTDSTIPVHLLAVAEVSEKRFVYEVWFISWREEPALFLGNGLVSICCVTSPFYITYCANYSGLPRIRADMLKLTASPAPSCLKKSSICLFLAGNGS